MLTLVSGGARSGKSRRAMELALRRKNPVFIATAMAFDEEMRERIEKHREERAGRFTTIEEPRDLGGALRRVPEDAQVCLIDCLTVWLGNLLHHYGEDLEGAREIDELIEGLRAPRHFDLVIVTNEVGSGIVPENAVARRYRDLAGALNQRVGAVADVVELCVCGIPVTVKGAAEVSSQEDAR